ncbi:hypothetical protein [Pelagibacterium lacus]|uniref:Uncharacterized protein n=1 Tax=Pelagibacterium lacus TaxID=2282655 RepID=A0A369W2M9_9HYPH|nr:hypothetical protein [Pelagibacterium lacus]RDE08936.1 hypothetical protein DVH29_09305 [Pelagibacterium lacus]
MLEWFAANSDMLNLVANWAMVVIWIAYLQIFLRSFRRQTLPKIVINRAAGSSLRAACFVSNMSSDAIYIESVIVKIETSTETVMCRITDFDAFDDHDESADPKLRTYQGPLAPSQYTSLGKFDDIIAMVARRKELDSERLKSAGGAIAIEITIIADYASEDLLIGARRTLRAEWQGDHWRLGEETPYTEQIRSRAERKRISQMLAAID